MTPRELGAFLLLLLVLLLGLGTLGCPLANRLFPRKPGVLRYTPCFVLRNFAGFSISVLLPYGYWAVGQRPLSAGWLAFFGAPALMFLWALVESLAERFHLTDSGLVVFRYGKKENVFWSDVARVSFSSAMGWFVLHLHSGKRLRISLLLQGIEDFARHLLQRVPSDRMDPHAMEVLHSTAEGHPPLPPFARG